MLMVHMGIYVQEWRYKKHAIVAASIAAALLAVALTVWTALIPRANALDANDRQGPNPSWFQNSARYALQNDAAVVGATSQTIPVYILNSAATADAGSKPPNDMVVRASSFTKGYQGNALSAAKFRTCAGETGYWQSDNNFTVPRSCFTYIPELNGWRAYVTALLYNNSGAIQFRLNIQSPNTGRELFGYSTANGATAFGIANEYRCDPGGQTTGCGRFYNWSIPFGTPCSINQNLEVRAGIYDGDNVAGTQYNIQYNRYFSVQVYDVTANQFLGIRFEGGEGNSQQAWYYFTVEPSHKYQFRVNNVYTNNLMQISLPYDSIESITDCSWDLKPAVTLNTTTAESNTAGITVQPAIDNQGKSTSKAVQWQLSRCRVAPGGPAAAYGAAPDNTSNGVTTYNARGATCQQVSSGTNQTFPKNVTNLTQINNQAIGNEPVGTRICYVLSVNPPTYSSASNVWRHSTPTCIVVAKKPKVQVWGGDLVVGKNATGNSNIQTSTSTKDISGVSRIFGSWVEYGIVATGSVSGAASGSGYAGGAADPAFCSVSLLTFTNAGTGSCSTSTVKGSYSTGKTLADLTTRFSATSSLGNNPSVNASSLANGVYSATGNVTINASAQIGKGRWVVINAPTANVTITGNISYTTTQLQTVQDIPQLIIIADNINIQGGVTNVDAWLVATGASGVITTCSDVSAATQLTANNCGQLLTVNGPVIAKKLNLYRTAGSGTGTASGAPAEVFNLRPDAYMWATNWSAKSGRVQTTYTKELPPRF